MQKKISNKKILVFTATYNEIDNIGKLLLKIKKFNSKVHILIIDDNSPDGTAQKVIGLKKKIKNLNIIIRSKKLGLDSAHKMAYAYALKNKYDYLITMDADLSHDPCEIKNFIKYLKEYSFVIGSRYLPKGKCLMQGRRLFLSKYGNIIIKKVLGIKLTEFTTSYRGFNLKKLKKFNLKQVKAKGYSFMMCVVFEIYIRNFDIKEIPIIFKDRLEGFSKIPRIETLRTLKNLFFLYLRKVFNNTHIKQRA
jgi:dolichol-phosphate mannosyltransferase